jgi:hypothetical protein
MITETLAAYRVTRLITQDEIARPAREAISDRVPGSQLEYLVNCPYCVSVWAGFAVLLLPVWARRALAVSGLICIGINIQEIIGEVVDRNGS